MKFTEEDLHLVRRQQADLFETYLYFSKDFTVADDELYDAGGFEKWFDTLSTVKRELVEDTLSRKFIANVRNAPMQKYIEALNLTLELSSNVKDSMFRFVDAPSGPDWSVKTIRLTRVHDLEDIVECHRSGKFNSEVIETLLQIVHDYSVETKTNDIFEHKITIYNVKLDAVADGYCISVRYDIK